MAASRCSLPLPAGDSAAFGLFSRSFLLFGNKKGGAEPTGGESVVLSCDSVWIGPRFVSANLEIIQRKAALASCPEFFHGERIG